MEQTCVNCRYKHKSVVEDPCGTCKRAYKDAWKPEETLSKADKIRALSDATLEIMYDLVYEILERREEK